MRGLIRVFDEGVSMIAARVGQQTRATCLRRDIQCAFALSG